MRRSAWKRFATGLLGVALLAVLGACAASSPAQETGSASAEAPRVVALSRSLAQMWVLAGGEPVGVTDDALDLEGVPDDTPSVGTLTTVSAEQVIALEPTLVLVSGELPSQKDVIATLEEAGVETLAASIGSFEDYDELMQRLVGLTGRHDLYEQNVTAVAGEIAAIKDRVSELDGGTYVALRVSATKNKVLKHDYFACKIFDELGLTNVADDSSDLDDLSLEAIVAADPTWVFVIPQGDEAEAAQAYEDAFASQPAWAQLAATGAGRVAQLPKDLFQVKPNDRWAEAYEYVFGLLEQGHA